jgi:hypothetical protein
MFACVGEVMLVALIGVPAALTLAWLGLRALATSSPALAVALTFLVALVVPSVIDPPLWVWPMGVGAVGCVVIALLGTRSERVEKVGGGGRGGDATDRNARTWRG